MLIRKVIKLLAISMITASILIANFNVAFAKSPENIVVFGRPSGLVQTEDGKILVTDIFNKVVWSYEDGKKVIVAGMSGVRDMYDEPIGGHFDSNALKATFNEPWGIAPYLDGYAITDSENNAVRYFNDGKITTIAGSETGESGAIDGVGTASRFNRPTGIVSDDNGDLYISDTGNGTIRKITKDGTVSTYAGKGLFLEPTGLAFQDGVIYVADTGNHRICKIENHKMYVVAGDTPIFFEGDVYPSGGYIDGIANKALFDNPEGIAIDDGVIYVSDAGNSAIRKISDGSVSTILKLEDDTSLYPISPRGIIAVEDRLYIADYYAGIVFEISLNDSLLYPATTNDKIENDLTGQ